MAIRNPFDQIILDDPAYAEETKIDPQAGKKLTRDIYGLILGEEDPYANKKLERELSVALAQKEAGLPVDPNKSFVTSAERQDPILGPALKKFGYESMGLGEVGERSLEFLYRDQEKARSKELRGEELTFGEKIAANPFMAALDAADFTGLIGLATKGGIKLSAKGLQTLTNLKNQGASKEVINQVMTKQFPDDAQKIGLVYYQNNRPPGMETSQIMTSPNTDSQSAAIRLTKGSSIPLDMFLQSTIKDKGDEFMKLANILNNTSLENINKPLKQIIEENNLTKLLKTDIVPGRKGGKKIVTQPFIKDAFRRYNLVPEDKLNKIDELTATQTYKKTEKPQQIKQFMEKALSDNTQFNYATEIAAEMGLTKSNFEKIMSQNPELKKLRDQIVTPKGEGTQNKFTNDFYNLFANKQEFVDQYKNMQNEAGQEIISEINALKRQAGIGNEVTTLRLFHDYAFDKYRSIVQTKGNEKLNAKTFFEKYMDDSDLDNFKEYAKLELDRNKANVLSRTALEELYQNPAYKPYLQNADGNLDVTLLQYDKAHDIPMFVTRKEGQGRLKTKGRFVGAGVDVELIQPNLQYSNNLQRRLDPYLNYFADILNNKTLENNFKNKPASIGKNKTANLNNPINKRLLDTLSEYGYNPDMSKFDNQYDFIKEVTQFIDTTYKDRKIRSIVPIREKGNIKSNTIFGIEEPNLLDPLQQVRGNVERLKELLDYNIENNISPDKARVKIQSSKKGGDDKSVGYLKGFKKGGPVKMAIGGDPLENINQQQFASDPATDDNFFQQAVQDENLLAFNPANLFKIFKQAPAVATPNKVVGGVPDAPTNMLPATAKVDIDDFPFKSHFIDTLSEQNIPNIDSPQGWRNLFSGTKSFAKSELEGAGIMGYLEDAEKFMPGMKITKQNLLDVYEKSPIANLEIKVKTEVPMPGDYKQYVGSAKHKNMGNAPIDEGGTDYRNIVINVKEIPGQDRPFFNSGHFDKDPNVLAFTRVANYKNATGDDVAVIQELQTDLITNLRKEQERVKATASAVRNKKQRLQENLINYPNDEYTKGELDRLNAQYPEEKLKFLETTDLTRPADPVFLEQLAPELTTQLNAIQDQINNILTQNRGRIVNPNYLEQIKQLQDQGLVVFNRLFDLNRQKNFDDMLQGAKVTDAYRSSQILDIGAGTNVPTGRDVQSFGQIPFGKGPDWIDLMLKSTIQDAQSRGINKVAIMPAEIVNKRWNKDIDGAAAEKFKAIYDKISVQELKNIAKKYTGNKANLQIEEIVDPNKPQQAFQVLNKNVDGTFAKGDRDIEPSMPVGSNIGPDDTADFNFQIYNVASDFDYGDVVVRKEIAPGQVMDYYVKIIKSKEPKIDPESGIDMSIARQDTIEFVPLKENQIAEDSKVIIEEYNPSLQKMYVLTMPEETTKKGPMFLFRKKDGGKIKSDGLVSITDIYGDY